MEDVELVARHEVEHAQHRGLRLKVARDVEHEAAVAEPRRVNDADSGQRESLTWRRCRQEIPQGLQPIEDASRRGTDDPDPARRIDHQLVRLRRRLPLDSAQFEAHQRVSQLGTEVGPEEFAREPRLIRELGCCCNPRHRRQSVLSRPPCDLDRRRKQGRELAQRDVAGRRVARELRRRGDDVLRALERSRDVIGQRNGDVFRVVEHDVRTARDEAAIEQRVGPVRNLDRRAGRETGEARAAGRSGADRPMTSSMLKPDSHGARVGRVQCAEVDRPTARRQRFRVAVREREGRVGIARELPAKLQSGLSGSRAGGEGQRDDGQ